MPTQEQARSDTFIDVPLRYKSTLAPRPCFIYLCKTSDLSDVSEFKVQGCEREAFRVLEVLCSELGVDLAHKLTVWTLSARCSPCGPLEGQCYAIPSEAAEWFWKGQCEVLKTRKRKKDNPKPEAVLSAVAAASGFDDPTENSDEATHTQKALKEANPLNH